MKHDNGSQCLVCQVISCVRKSSVERHYNTRHRENYSQYVGGAREEKLAALKSAKAEEDSIGSTSTEVGLC